MKKLFPIIFLLPVLFLLLRCEDDDEPTTNLEAKIEIYYTYGDSINQPIENKDTITVDLGDTLSVFIELTGIESDAVELAGTDNFEIEKTGDLEYACVAKGTGVGDIAAYSSDLSSNLRKNFYVAIPSFSYLFLIVEEPVFVVDVENESLKTEIEAELEDDAPNINDRYWLSCDAVDGGDLLVVTDEKDTLDGIFTSSNVIEMTDVTMYYNNSSYNFTLEESEEKGYLWWYLKQDLTEEFRTKYPSETINEVTITTLAVKNKEE